MSEIEQKYVNEECKDTGNQEIWKDIPGYEGFYIISNFGTIKSLARNIPSIQVRRGKRIEFVRKKFESILTPNKNSKGYLKVKLYKDNTKKLFSVHRLVGIAFIPNPYNLPEINHKDGDKENNYFENLEWCSTLENLRHARKTGLNKGKKRLYFTGEEIYASNKRKWNKYYSINKECIKQKKREKYARLKIII